SNRRGRRRARAPPACALRGRRPVRRRRRGIRSARRSPACPASYPRGRLESPRPPARSGDRMLGRRPLASLAVLLIPLVASGWLAAAAAQAGDDGATPLWQLVEKIAEKRGFSKELAALIDHQQKLVRGSAASLHPLSRVTDMLAQPWKVPVVARELRDALSAPFGAKGAKGSGALEPVAAQAARFLDLGGA